MSNFAIIIAYLRAKKFSAFLHVLMLAFAVALMLLIMQTTTQLQSKMQRDAANIDVVLGAKGSPIQLVLSSVYHADVPTGNVPFSTLKMLENRRELGKIVPLSLGDSYHGFRIVGTTPAYAELYATKFAQGGFWQKSMQAVVGADVAKKTGLKLGDKFAGNHGLVAGGEVHSDSLYEVVGILQPSATVVDRLLLTSLDSVWDIHSHHKHKEHEHHHEEVHHEDKHAKKEITAVLINYKNKAAALNFPRYINTKTNFMAASPALESARLFQMVGVSADGVLLFAGIVLAISLLGVFVSMLTNVNERKYDIAVMRSLGARPASILQLVVGEAVIIGFAGALLGLALGHLGLFAAGEIFAKAAEIGLGTSAVSNAEIGLVFVVVGLAFAAAIIPAYFAYKTDVVKTLAKHNI